MNRSSKYPRREKMENMGIAVETPEPKTAIETKIASELKNEDGGEKKISSADEILEEINKTLEMTFFLKVTLKPRFSFTVVGVAKKEQKVELLKLDDINFKMINSSNDSEKYVIRAALHQRRLEIKDDKTWGENVLELTASLLIATMSEQKKIGKKKRICNKKRKGGRPRVSKKGKVQYLCFKEVGTDEEFKKIAEFSKISYDESEFRSLLKPFIKGEFLRALENSKFAQIDQVM